MMDLAMIFAGRALARGLAERPSDQQDDPRCGQRRDEDVSHTHAVAETAVESWRSATW